MIRPSKKSGWCAIALTCVAGFEGVRQYVYLDPVGIPTWCFGETQGPRPVGHIPMAQCEALLAESLEIANRQVDSCVRTYLPDARRAALVSFTFNIGGGAFCSSTLVRKLNAGDTAGACNELPKWVFARGIKLPGLVNRRQEERALCLQGLPL